MTDKSSQRLREWKSGRVGNKFREKYADADVICRWRLISEGTLENDEGRAGQARPAQAAGGPRSDCDS